MEATITYIAQMLWLISSQLHELLGTDTPYPIPDAGSLLPPTAETTPPLPLLDRLKGATPDANP